MSKTITSEIKFIVELDENKVPEKLNWTAQDGGVAGLQAEPRCIRGHVWPGLVNDAYDPKRNAHSPDLDAGGTIVQISDGADRVRQLGNLPQSFGHRSNGLCGDRQAVDKGRIAASGPCLDEIRGIRGKQACPIAFEGVGGGAQRVIFRRCIRHGHDARRRAGILTHGAHVGSDIKRRIHDAAILAGRAGMPAPHCAVRIGETGNGRRAAPVHHDGGVGH